MPIPFLLVHVRLLEEEVAYLPPDEGILKPRTDTESFRRLAVIGRLLRRRPLHPLNCSILPSGARDPLAPSFSRLFRTQVFAATAKACPVPPLTRRLFSDIS